MANDEVDQQCPFCNEPWGKCEHYEMLEGLEDEADGNEISESSEQHLISDGRH